MKTYIAYFDAAGVTYTQTFEARTQNEAVNFARKFARDHAIRYMYLKRSK